MSINILNHRDANDCPFCGFNQDGLDWLKTKVNTCEGSKENKMIVVSYCPKCFEYSWRHYDKESTIRVLDAMILENEVIIN